MLWAKFSGFGTALIDSPLLNRLPIKNHHSWNCRSYVFIQLQGSAFQQQFYSKRLRWIFYLELLIVGAFPLVRCQYVHFFWISWSGSWWVLVTSRNSRFLLGSNSSSLKSQRGEKRVRGFTDWVTLDVTGRVLIGGNLGLTQWTVLPCLVFRPDGYTFVWCQAFH